jgi:hypothetical protein
MGTTLQEKFEARIDTAIGIAEHCFHGLPGEARDEAISNTLALSWKYYLRLAALGKEEDDRAFNSMVHWATRHTRQGRMPQSRGKSKDALDYRNRGRARFDSAFTLDGFVDERTPIPDAVAYRIDVPAFLATLSEKNQALAYELAQGMTTDEVAKRHGVTPGAISQFRTRFKTWFEKFQGEP